MADDKSRLLEEQLRVMADKLKEAAEQLPDEELVITYDNGGGQSGIRENPFYSAYTKLLNSDTRTYTIWKDVAGGKSADISSLDEIRARFKVAK